MANYQPTYLGEIELSEESLTHYGVKGMKWRRRKANLKKRNVNRKARERSDRHTASHLAEDVLDGRRVIQYREDGDNTPISRVARRYPGQVQITRDGGRGRRAVSADSGGYGDNSGNASADDFYRQLHVQGERRRKKNERARLLRK